MALRVRARPDVPLVELIVPVMILGIIGAAAVRLFVSQARCIDQQVKERPDMRYRLRNRPGIARSTILMRIAILSVMAAGPITIVGTERRVVRSHELSCSITLCVRAPSPRGPVRSPRAGSRLPCSSSRRT